LWGLGSNLGTGLFNTLGAVGSVVVGGGEGTVPEGYRPSRQSLTDPEITPNNFLPLEAAAKNPEAILNPIMKREDETTTIKAAEGN
jgi:hypothetical protein